MYKTVHVVFLDIKNVIKSNFFKLLVMIQWKRKTSYK